ncbi:MAG: ATP-binding protein, partial [Candidatus Zixiibacteriota bacterium]
GAQIHRVILNLLLNARDAMADEGTILIRTENYYIDQQSIAYGKVPRGEYVKLTLTDSGCGIPDGLLQTIFDPFVTSKTTDKKRGSGLGLSVVDAVVKDHDGYIDLNTEPGKGTSFYLYFPVTREAIDEPDPSLSVGGSESILVVDDDEVQREVCSQLLMKSGYDVTVVDGGERAIEYLAQHACDLLILDMVMPPGIDGAETYRQATKLNPNQKAIIVSGYSQTDRVAFAQGLGAGAFVKKPFTGKSISAAVRKEIDREQKVPV